MSLSAPANGYTLIDMLAALFILGLALAGLGQGMFALARLQGATTRTVEASSEIRRAQSALSRLLSVPAATPDRLMGDSGELSFECGAASCHARLNAQADGSRLLVQGENHESDLRLSGVPPIRFSYVLDEGVSEIWPIPDQRLVAVQIQQADGRVLVYHQLWRQQPLDCAYDPVSRRCPTSP